MPREQIRADGHDRRRSLGHLANAWIEHFVVHGPGDVQGVPVVLVQEFYDFHVDAYAVGDEATNNHLLYDSAFFSRPKGCDKSGEGSRLSLFEALGPCRFAGWAEGGEVYRDPWGLGFEYEYEPGEPMGAPVTVPYIRIMATEEGQTGNTYDAIYYNLTDDDALLSKVPGVKAGLWRVDLPGGGEITPSTASSASKDGGKETFVVFDETHLYNTAELRRMYATVTRNMRKRKKNAGTWYLETTTMYARGEKSIAEDTYKEAQRIKERRPKRQRLLYDHRWGECEDLTNLDHLAAAILEAFGEAIEWNDLQGIIDGFFDTRNDAQDQRRYFLNAAADVADAWFFERDLQGIFDPDAVLADRDVIALGFDGSRKRSRGVTDATALIACRLRDRCLFEIRIWEQPTGPDGEKWEIPRLEVDAEVRQAFRQYSVVAFYADPAKWDETVGRWEVEYGPRLKKKATREHPIQWWMTGARNRVVVAALKLFGEAVFERTVKHNGAAVMVRHLLNGRRRSIPKVGVTVMKEHPDSEKKIDGFIASLLAYTAAMDALAAGVKPEPERVHVPRRIR
jgi:hypothetical protein